MIGDWLHAEARQRGNTYLVLLLFLAICIGAAGVAMIIHQAHYAQRIYPGVRVEEMDLRGKARSEAKTLLEDYYRDYAQRPILLSDAQQSWMASLADMGVSVDINATVAAAYALGRSGEFRHDIRTQLELLLKDRSLTPVLDLDEGRCAVYLGRLARDIDHPARNASLVITGLQVRVEPSRPGRELAVAATCQRLREQLGSSPLERLELSVVEIRPPVLDVEMGRAQAERILSAPIILSFSDRVPDAEDGTALTESKRTWTLDQAALAKMLVIRQVATPEGRVDLSIGLDREELAEWVSRLDMQIARPSRDARFEYNPVTGQLVPTVMSQDGLALNITDTVGLIESQVKADQRVIPLSVESTPARVSVEHSDELGIRELMGRGETFFKGSSEERARNIEVAAARFHGVVVLPGETFSFNHYLGAVSEAYGFEESWVIFGDRTILGPGGGVCQVSTTCFRAAFFGGFPIVERWPHAYRVGWYEPPLGLDAAIFSPSVDFKFTNDTKHAVLIQTHADRVKESLIFDFYGTGTGRTVEMEEPQISDRVPPPDPVYELDPSLPPGTKKQLESSREGLDVTLYRIIRWPDGSVKREEFFSRFQPWPERYKVGPEVETEKEVSEKENVP
ncbi:MAG: VanW family protein [Anaerolineae bacterium]|nr:VanW family protein [Anaerolineae bacterium]